MYSKLIWSLILIFRIDQCTGQEKEKCTTKWTTTHILSIADKRNVKHCFFVPRHGDLLYSYNPLGHDHWHQLMFARAQCKLDDAILPHIRDGEMWWRLYQSRADIIKEAKLMDEEEAKRKEIKARWTNIEYFLIPLGVNEWTSTGKAVQLIWDNGMVINGDMNGIYKTSGGTKAPIKPKVDQGPVYYKLAVNKTEQGDGDFEVIEQFQPYHEDRKWDYLYLCHKGEPARYPTAPTKPTTEPTEPDDEETTEESIAADNLANDKVIGIAVFLLLKMKRNCE